jgi:acyl carrier protein
MSEESLVKRDHLPLPRRYVEPRTQTEARVAKIWATVLSMDRVGIEDRYTDLGADSFHATVIFEMIEEDFGIALPLVLFAETATVAALASKIDMLLAPRKVSDL